MPLILPPYHQGDFVTSFKIKAKLFNFFASQCSFIENDNKFSFHLNYKTDNHLLTENFYIDGISKILHNLDHKKAHYNDKINIRILQICGNLSH